MSSAPPVTQVEQLLAARRFQEAASLLFLQAEQGDGEALFTLATWRISGQIVRRDLAAARETMAKAAKAGHREAARLHAHFLANGTGGAADWKRARAMLAQIAMTDPDAAQQLAALEGMAVGDDGDPTHLADLETVSESPAIYRARHFLTDDECAYLVRKGAPRLRPSVVTHRETGRVIAHPTRRSDGTFFGVAFEDLVVNAINRRIAAISATRVEQGEPMQLFRYGIGGEFRPHHDFMAEGDNQRIFTALVYLSDDYEGGETRFLSKGLDFRGEEGELLLFRNVTKEGAPDPLTEHAGLPVRKGTKLIASRWICRSTPTFPAPRALFPDL